MQTLYRMYDENGALLYIGISCDVFTRLSSHSITKDWFDRVRQITLEIHSSREDVEDAERRAIRSENPEFNVTFAGVKAKRAIYKRVETQRRREKFSRDICRYVELSGKSWFDVSYELGVCHTALSRWKNAKICPSLEMLERIECWSGGEIKKSEYEEFGAINLGRGGDAPAS